MRKRIVVFTATLLVLVVGVLSLSGCNTWRGAGKDVENTGDAMQGD
jgi:predicted small secreted protein